MNGFGQTVIASTLLLIFFNVATAEPATQPTTAPSTQPSGADLVRVIRDRERWLDDVRTLHARWEGRFMHSPESIKIAYVALKKADPTTEPIAANEIELRPETPTMSEIAFDERRILSNDEWRDDYIQHCVWDGRRAVARERYLPSDQDGGSIRPEIGKLFDGALSDLLWLRSTHHSFWWLAEPKPGDDFVVQMSVDVPADSFVVTRRATFRGVDCWVLDQTRHGRERWYVGVIDGHLYGSTFVDGLPDNDPRAVRAAVETAAEGGQVVADVAAFEAWRATLPEPASTAAYDAFRFARDRDAEDGTTVRWAWDYREVVPGGWLPMREGYRLNGIDPETKRTYELMSRERHVTQFTLNQPLDDALFSTDLPDGVKVYDTTRDPPMAYVTKADRTAEEWAPIIAKATADRDATNARHAAQDRWNGKPPPPFGERRWLNVAEGTAAPTWASLRGKIVLLDFSAEWCGPCRNDWPTLVALHGDAANADIVVLSLHPPGSSDAKIQAMMDDFKMTYPICIDTPAPAGVDGFGELFAAYGVDAIPTCFVIDAAGNVAGHGTLRDALTLIASLRQRR